MPEGLEAEIWARAARSTVGREIVRVRVDERVSPPGFAAAVTGATIEAVRRVGKIVLLELGGPADETIGLHFGMTGRLVVDGAAPIERLAYASGRDDPEWDRLRVWTGDRPDGAVPALRVSDPRRLGRVSLSPDLSHIGVDIFSVTARRLAPRLGRRRPAVKSVLLDQAVVAGLGNLCADEVLWWSGIDPRRPAASLGSEEIAALAGAIRRRLPVMMRRGGSTHGTLTPDVRAACPPCPRDGGPLARVRIGGRTTVWCPLHQR